MPGSRPRRTPSTTTTTTILLDGLHDPVNDEAWSEFDRRYRPVLIGFARHLGLNDPDAADVAQETMARFVQEYREGRYDRDRGRLRSWLIGLAKYRVAETYRRRSRKREVPEGPAVIELADDVQLTQVWESQRRAVMLQEAMARLRGSTRTDERTIRAFELLVLNELSPAEVAEQMDMSKADVYRAKNRIADRLQCILEALETGYEGQ